MSQPMQLSMQYCCNKMAGQSKNVSQVINLEWDGKNVSKVFATSANHNISISFTYDNKINPFDGFFHVLYIINPYSVEHPNLSSRNNVLTMTTTQQEIGSMTSESEVHKFEYTYNGDYPTSVTYPVTFPDSYTIVERYQYE